LVNETPRVQTSNLGPQMDILCPHHIKTKKKKPSERDLGRKTGTGRLKVLR